MKKKAILVALLCVMGLTALSIGNAEAGWYTCTISQVGMNYNANGYQIVVSDTATTPAFTNMMFTIDTAVSTQNQMYAAALTAFANSTYVDVFVNAPIAGYKARAIIARK